MNSYAGYQMLFNQLKPDSNNNFKANDLCHNMWHRIKKTYVYRATGKLHHKAKSAFMVYVEFAERQFHLDNLCNIM